MAENENAVANETTEAAAPKPVAKRIGNGNGRVVVGFAGSVTYDPAKRTIRIASVSKARTIAWRGHSYAGSITLNANETDAVLASIGITDAVPTMVRGMSEWKRFASALTGATTGLRGIVVALPDVPKPARGRKAGTITLDATDASVLARLASLNA